MRQRKQSSTSYPILLYMVLSSDHTTAATGKTVSVTLSKNGAAPGAAVGSVSEIGGGWYALAGNSTDRDTVGPLAIRATASGCDDYPVEYTIVPWDPFDATRLGILALPNANAEAAGGLITRGTGPGQAAVSGGRIEADTKLIEGGDATDALLAAAEAALASTDATLGAVAADILTLLSRLSALRAGYLDNLSGGAVALATSTTAAAIREAVGLALANLDAQLGLLPTATETAEEVDTVLSAAHGPGAWDEGIFDADNDDHDTPGTVGGNIAAAGGSQDPDELAANIAAQLAGMGNTVTDNDSNDPSTISKRRGDLWTVPFTDLGAFGTWSKLWLTIKSGDTTDANATLQVLVTNPGAVGDGLQRLNGGTATAAQAAIVVDDEDDGDITVTVQAAATAQLSPTSYDFDIQILRPTGPTTLNEGSWTVRRDATRATS